MAAALALAGIGLYLSFGHVAAFAFDRLHFASLGKGQLFAVGVDTGIMVMIAVDLLMAWLKRPIGWIRYPVWLLTAATVVLNAASAAPQGRGWRLLDYVAAGAHGVVPVLFIMVVEVGRDSIDRIVRPEQVERDSIPLIRWVLAPIATPRIYRRMRLYDVHSYPEMVRRDQDLIAYEVWLKRKHGGDLGKATEDELLPMTMAPHGYTVARALAMPDDQDRAAEDRAEEAERRRLEADTRRRLAETQAQAEALRADGQVETVRAQVQGATGQARAHAQAQVTAAERAARAEEEALETAVMAEAKARTAAAQTQEAAERKARADLDLEAAELEQRAAEKRREAAEADRIAAAETQAVETQTIAEARLAAAEANRSAAETLKGAAETRLAVAETNRLADEERAAQAAALAAVEQSNLDAAEAVRAAAEIRLAAAEIERAAVEAEDVAKLRPRERAVRKVARMILALADPDADAVWPADLPLADIQRELEVSSASTASEYRLEAGELIAAGYRP
ncbi:DUF2637 domain-containing protein [Kitasatospora sp. NBC_00240]|uniref:DUF2637 domain-containing protein n=1 Tax=Kitasatospora sp. NBC_00240 TaxID=2903567 RepID=UPI002258097E|nr:DUF2637 domain-containing protein [Kitasatospora sp. NBC_00240]